MFNHNDLRDMTLGELIKRERQQKRLSLRRLAALLELSPSYIHDLEHDLRLPSDEVINALALVLNLSSTILAIMSGRLTQRAKDYLKVNRNALDLVEYLAVIRPSDAILDKLKDNLIKYGIESQNTIVKGAIT